MSALTDTFTAIANAIRGKLGVQTTYTPTQMSSAIASIPTQKPEQTKSVTATTSQQTVSPDSGKVLSSVTVNPQVHSATYTPTGYSNANDMGAQNNYRYVDTSGYQPTSITPSDSSPVAVSSGGIYQMGGNGYAIESQPTSITPSNSSPVFLATDGIYKTSSSGYAISSYATKTPSDTSPASVSINSLIQPTSAGYLYKTQQTKTVTLLGSITLSNTMEKSLSLSDSIKNYRYLLCSMTAWSSGLKGMGVANSGIMMIDSDSYVSGFTATGSWVSGSNGSYTAQTITYTYASNTSISVKNSSSNSRTVYIYGVK